MQCTAFGIQWRFIAPQWKYTALAVGRDFTSQGKVILFKKNKMGRVTWVTCLSDRNQTVHNVTRLSKTIRKTQFRGQDFYSSQPPRIAEIKAVVDRNLKGKRLTGTGLYRETNEVIEPLSYERFFFPPTASYFLEKWFKLNLSGTGYGHYRTVC
jgi:hypothetical protein